MFKNEYLSDPDKKAQHDAVRNSAGWYLFTHQIMEVTGEDATAFLDMIYVGPIAKAKIGAAKYTTMLNEDGNIIDDVIVFRLEENKYWVSTLYLEKLEEWFDEKSKNYSVDYEDITDDIEMYAIQGPQSRDFLGTVLEDSIEEQRFFTLVDNKIDGIPVKVARTGFTGELGYEVYIERDKAGLLEEKLTANSKQFGARRITEFQVMVLTLPSEKGYALMCDIGETNPLEVGFDVSIDWEKDFIGKPALEKIRAEGAKRQLLGFTVENDDAHIASRHKGAAGEAVLFEGEEVGRVTKYTYGFTVGTNIGYALVNNEVSLGDTVFLNGNPATLTTRVWYDPENNRPFGR
jgi:aminomethyltransferase